MTAGVQRSMRVARIAAVSLALLAAGCATQPKVLPIEAGVGEIKELDIAGRIAVKQGKEGHSGGVRWRHAPPNHDIKVLSPLGQVVAQIVEDANGVTLTTADKETVRAADPDSLIESVLGWRLPVRGMGYWVLGKASPNSEAKLENGDGNRVAKIEQDDWQILYSNYRPIGGTELPSKIVMRRADIEVRMVVDSWKILRTE